MVTKDLVAPGRSSAAAPEQAPFVESASGTEDGALEAIPELEVAFTEQQQSRVDADGAQALERRAARRAVAAAEFQAFPVSRVDPPSSTVVAGRCVGRAFSCADFQPQAEVFFWQ